MGEQEILERLNLIKHSEGIRLVCDLLLLKREKYRDKLESMESDEIRGRSKECRDLLAILR
jgi:hypothetical protein